MRSQHWTDTRAPGTIELFPSFLAAPSGSNATTRGANRRTDYVAGKRVLVVEDEFFLGLDVEAALRELGCITIGPATTLEEAIETAQRETIEGAVLDINLGGRLVYPLAEELARRGVPFIFTTGYRPTDLPPALHGVPRLDKPVAADQLKAAVRAMLAQN